MTATPGGQLRELMAGEPFIAVECHSPLTARIVQRAGIPAALMPGSPTAAMHFGIPDNGVLTTTEMIELSGRVHPNCVLRGADAGCAIGLVHRVRPRSDDSSLQGTGDVYRRAP